MPVKGESNVLRTCGERERERERERGGGGREEFNSRSSM